MRNELTQKDIELMRQELEHRRTVLRPQLIEAVKEARAFGDLSENFEYKCAKQEKNRNESRIRYLERMIKTAKVISASSGEDCVGLFDRVVVYNEKLEKEMTLRIVTTLRQDARQGLISKESPVGRALLGRRVGERVLVKVSPELSYHLTVRSLERGRTTRDWLSVNIEEGEGICPPPPGLRTNLFQKVGGDAGGRAPYGARYRQVVSCNFGEVVVCCILRKLWLRRIALWRKKKRTWSRRRRRRAQRKKSRKPWRTPSTAGDRPWLRRWWAW